MFKFRQGCVRGLVRVHLEVCTGFVRLRWGFRGFDKGSFGVFIKVYWEVCQRLSGFCLRFRWGFFFNKKHERAIKKTLKDWRF